MIQKVAFTELDFLGLQFFTCKVSPCGWVGIPSAWKQHNFLMK